MVTPLKITYDCVNVSYAYLRIKHYFTLLQGYIVSPCPVVCVEYCRLAVGSGHCLTHTDSCRNTYMTIWSDAAVLDSGDVMSWSTEVLWTALDTNSKCSFFCKVTAPSRSLPAQHSLVFSSSAQASTDIIPRLSEPLIFLPACPPQPEHDTITCIHTMHALKKSVC